MDLDQAGAVAAEYAERAGVPAPKVRPGRVPQWSAGGAILRLRLRKGTVVVDSRFLELDEGEQEAGLAYLVSAVASVRRYNRNAMLSLVPLLAGAVLIEMSLLGAPRWIAEAAFWSYLLGWVLLLGFWYRRCWYEADRRLVAVFGWTAMDTVLEVERREPARPPFYLRAVPTPDQRTARLERISRTPA
ncbi:hypothetical protein [Spirillospora sp. NPDC029432]|uniref:hypothetical protein n=1 Tax=Spirillospora sp. NPDC029432 TaxID=3154599 RepID=UPI0034564A54